MTHDEFICKAIGVPWAKHQSTWQSMDCYGLVMLYYKEVLGVNLGLMPNMNMSDGYEAKSKEWSESSPVKSGLAFMTFKGGQASHCGIVIDDMHVIHSGGSEQGYGSVKIDKIASLERIFGKMKFYAYNL